MKNIQIQELTLERIINTHCSCGGRGPDDDCCVACSVFHEIRKQGVALDNLMAEKCVMGTSAWWDEWFFDPKDQEDETRRRQ